jgi:hypothetical protein
VSVCYGSSIEFGTCNSLPCNALFRNPPRADSGGAVSTSHNNDDASWATWSGWSAYVSNNMLSYSSVSFAYFFADVASPVLADISVAHAHVHLALVAVVVQVH